MKNRQMFIHSVYKTKNNGKDKYCERFWPVFGNKFQDNNSCTSCLQKYLEYLQKYLSIGQVLLAQSHERKEALDYDKYAVCIFKRHEEDISKLSLVGHVRVELSKLLNQFLKADTGSCI